MSVATKPPDAAAPGATSSGLGARWWAGLVLGPLAYVLPQIIDPLPEVTPVGMRTFGTFLLVVTWWICETLPFR